MLGYRQGIFAMAFHTQRQSLDTLNELPGIIRGDAGPQVTEGTGAHPKNESQGSEGGSGKSCPQRKPW